VTKRVNLLDARTAQLVLPNQNVTAILAVLSHSAIQNELRDVSHSAQNV
jgi:hypothetical protein